MARKKGLSRNTKILGVVSFLNDASSEMLEPIVPLFLVNVLGANAFILGLLEGWTEILVAVNRFISGRLSDKYKNRKNLMLFGYSLSTVMKVFFAYVGSWQQFFALKTVERVGKGIRTPPRDALIGDSEPSTRLGAAFGFRKMMDSSGAILGPLLAAFMLAFFAGMGEESIYRTIFMIAVIPAALGVGMLFFVRENPKQISRIMDGTKIFDGHVKDFMIVAAFFSLGQIGTAFFVLRTSELLPLVMVPVAYIAYTAAYAAFAIPAGLMTDKIGPKKIMMLSYILFAAGSLVFAFSESSLAPFIGFLLMGMFIAIIETTPRVYLVETVPGHRYASAIGTYQAITGVLLLPANLIAGLLWETQWMGAHIPFIFSAAVAVVSVVLMYVFVKPARGNHH
ncbi:MAG: MFS transporter [Candidatus Micrarchaeia archaeon]|jgi:MFS family permease